MDGQPPAVNPAAPGHRLWRNRDFNVFWAGQALSALGDSFAFVALPLLVLQATGSVAQMGLVTATFGAGDLIAGAVSGLLVDRMDRRRLMIACDLGRAALYSTIPLAWWTAGPQLWLIYVVTGLGALLGNTFQVASITALPNLVDRDQITEANGRFQTVLGVMFLVGPMLAGLVSQGFGPAVAIGLDALSFLASVLSLLFIRLRHVAAATSRSGTVGWLGELLAGARFLWQQPVLRAVSILYAGFAFLSVSAVDLIIFYVKHDLGEDDSIVGIIFGLASAGAIVGGLTAPRLRRRWGFTVCWLGGSVLSGLALAVAGLVGTAVLIAVPGLLYIFADTVRAVNSISLRQEITPDPLLGRVTAAFWMLSTVPGPLGAAVTTAVAARIGAPDTLILMGLVSIGLAAAGLFTPIWRQRAQLSGAA